MATEDLLHAGPLVVRVSAEHGVQVGWGEPDWLGPGHLVGRDGSFSMRAHATEPVAILRLQTPHGLDDDPASEFAKPALALHFNPTERVAGGAPAGMRAFGHQYTEFALPVFSDASLTRWRLLPIRPAVLMPFGVSAPDGRTIVLAPLDAFHEQIVAVAADPDADPPGIRVGWHGDIGAVPAGFATELAIIAGHGARECFATWARLLHTAPKPRDADALGTHVSYWTDNGSAYWYRTEPGLDAASSVVAAVDDLEARGVPIGAVQLDSWWYPHETLRPFNTDEWVVPPSGMTRWEPRADVFPDGITPVRERLGRRPLVAHCRHLSAKTPYRDEFDLWIDGDRAHPVDGALYERLFDQAVAWGIEVFEHDWLIECFLGVRGLRGAGRAAEWQRAMDDGLRARNMHAQWCMGSPADFAQATQLQQVSSIRTSGDHGYLVGPEFLWAWFLHTNVMARALGLWPYKDVFHAALESEHREIEALLSALSAGPVGIGDRAGAADVAVVRRTCRADGVLVRPDVPIAAIDRAVFDAPIWSGTLLTASAHTQHEIGRFGYVLTCNAMAKPQNARTRVALADLGEDAPASGPVVVYDWRHRSVTVADGFDVELAPLEWDYRVVVPVVREEIALIGDPNLYASAGDARVARVTASEPGITATVLGANEQITIVGWSARPVSATTWSPAHGTSAAPVTRDAASGRWEVEVNIGPAGWVHLHIAT
jgi:hypothetical protein